MKKPAIESPIELKVEAPVNPSEDPQKVIGAIEMIIERCSPEFRYGSRIVGRGSGIEPFSILYEQIRSRSAMGVLRRMLVDNRASARSGHRDDLHALLRTIVAAVKNGAA